CRPPRPAASASPRVRARSAAGRRPRGGRPSAGTPSATATVRAPRRTRRSLRTGPWHLPPTHTPYRSGRLGLADVELSAAIVQGPSLAVSRAYENTRSNLSGACRIEAAAFVEGVSGGPRGGHPTTGDDLDGAVPDVRTRRNGRLGHRGGDGRDRHLQRAAQDR